MKITAEESIRIKEERAGLESQMDFILDTVDREEKRKSSRRLTALKVADMPGHRGRHCGETGAEFHISEERLRLMYLDEQLSMGEVSRQLGCSYEMVRNAVRRYRIPVRQRHNPAMDVTAEQLYRWYWDEGRSLNQIAMQVGCGITRIRARMVQLGITRRQPGCRYRPGEHRHAG